MKLRKIGLPHSLHLTRPMSEVDVSGRTPNSFISRAVSHEVGGDGSDDTVDGGESTSHDMNGRGLPGFSLRVIMIVTNLSRSSVINYKVRVFNTVR